MKYARLVIGFIVIFAAIWIIVGEQMSGASADAVVNAPVVTVRSDVAGTLDMPQRAYGSRIAQGEVLATVTDELVDTVRLNDLIMEQDLARAEAARLSADIDATQAVLTDLRARTDVFRSNRLDELRTRLDHARVRLQLLEGGDFPDGTDQRLIDGLDDLQDRLPGEPLVDALVLDHARERVEVLQIALRAAEAGVFLGDGYNDSPNAEQRATELDSVLADQQNALTEAEGRVDAIQSRIDRERVRVNALRGGEMAAPVNGLYWDILQADGVTVQRGDPLLRLVNCDEAMVTLSVTERVYNDLRIGQAATFRLEGQSELFDATVARLAGSGAATVYEHLAVAPSQKHLERYDVMLQVPGLAADPEAGCLIGQTGRAFFDRRPLDLFRG
ncbi:HlyD family secretion protein [Pseudooceanicola nanhaiensis]|uniref:HlyD family secretion protein n=1 Tax=Pseudooceanicola nanhaiensis TaxID=375761 RepID=UPI001CD5EE78|nr:HlyD family efflux transporter periplasmic adaptor subunit [Pseudooceanicola nanhaiensis]MCA0919895.1 HlyD family secretion protein [Pseudooceanicola nanhaiensis]